MKDFGKMFNQLLRQEIAEAEALMKLQRNFGRI